MTLQKKRIQKRLSGYERNIQKTSFRIYPPLAEKLRTCIVDWRRRGYCFYTKCWNHFETGILQVLRGVGLGKVRIDVVKKTARKLMESYPDKFTADFEENKKMVTQLLDPTTKWMRNRISGYVTTLKMTEEKRKAAMTTPVESET